MIRRQAKRKLQGLSRVERYRIVEKIALLGENPDEPGRDVKPLAGETFYRLRVGRWRVIFDRQDDLKIIAIERIGPRGDVYK
ncbi:MAG: type II toxin-antitoxin system RelE/ParE family toxin [Nitrospinae bacterium]|nr:type II toxin-antitoxin system RelE/ParE family toxin [Nitrospinota bacterium]